MPDLTLTDVAFGVGLLTWDRGVAMPHTRKLLDWSGALTVTQGRLAGQPFAVLPWQRRFLRGAFADGVSSAAVSLRHLVPRTFLDQQETRLMTTKLIKLHEVTRITSLSRSTIYQAMADGQFPQPLRTGARGVAWVEQEVLDWIAARPRAGSDRPSPH